MKRFSIFRTGKHTAMSGTTLDFSEDQLRAAVAAYDPQLHEAPITVGHPKDNLPAYGWIQALHYNEQAGEIDVEPHQVEEQFGEMVAAGRFKKRSASWYLPDSPNNPKPGTLYLRHVAFLGAQPPAVKGLKDVQFSEDGSITVEFADRWTWSTIAGLFRNMREHFISTADMETADRLIPAYAITELEDAARAPETDNLPMTPAFTEEDPMKIEELQARVTALETENANLKANQKPENFGELETSLQTREAALAAREQAVARTGVEARVEKAIKAGKLLPAQKASTVNFAMGLAEGEAMIDFGEGDKAEKVTQREAYLRQIEAAPVAVDYNEHSAPDGSAAPEGLTTEKLAERARALQAESTGDGKKPISFTEAVALATAEFTAE